MILAGGKSICEDDVGVAVSETTHLLQPLPSAPPSAPPTNMPMYRVVVDNECVVCFDSAVNSVLVPCGHVALCVTCARRLTSCPICRANISDIHKIDIQ